MLTFFYSRNLARFGSNLDLSVQKPRNSPILAISTRTQRKDSSRDPEKVEKMVIIQCERLTDEREQEEVEIEIPLSVYNNMQAHSRNPGLRLRVTGRTGRTGLVHRIKKLFEKD